MTVPVDQNYIA